MFRRQARLQREYMAKKAQEAEHIKILAKKDKLKNALDENKLIPTELRREALALQNQLEWENEGATNVTVHEDDEYRWAGVSDPKIVVTTSRDPSSKLKQFAKEIKLLFPNSQRINRGSYEFSQLLNACRSNDVTDVVILHEHRGIPDGMIVSHLPLGPTAYFTISDCVMRHDIPDIGTISEEYPHLVFDNFTSRLGERTKSILRYLFPVPNPNSHRIVSFVNRDDAIVFRHHNYKVENGTKVELKEVGPRFNLQLYKIILGTVDTAEAADIEWVYRPYMNTAKKRMFLAQ